MSSEWMKVMLEEIARKKAQEEQERAEAVAGAGSGRRARPAESGAG
jgi:hypothetical protein